jgi:hypothetical protein
MRVCALQSDIYRWFELLNYERSFAKKGTQIRDGRWSNATFGDHTAMLDETNILLQTLLKNIRSLLKNLHIQRSHIYIQLYSDAGQ